MSESTLRRRLVMTFVALAALIVVLVVGAVILSVRLYDAQSAVVDRLFTTYEAAADVNAALLDQETGFRGYALTGNEDFLAPYDAGAQGRCRRAAAAAGGRERLPGPDAEPGRHGAGDPVLAPAGGRPGHREGARRRPAGRRGPRPGQGVLRRGARGGRGLPPRDRDPADSRGSTSSTGTSRCCSRPWRPGCCCCSVSAWLTWVALRRWVTQPLEQLGAEVDRVEGGDLSRQVVGDRRSGGDRRARRPDRRDAVRGSCTSTPWPRPRAGRRSRRARLVEEQAEDLRRSNTELEQFAYVASHDLQEPLRKVASFCQLIEHRYKGQLDERGEQYIEFAVDGAKRMQQLINDLLAFSRVGRVAQRLHAGRPGGVAGAGRAAARADRLPRPAQWSTHDPLPTIEGDHACSSS